MDSIADWEGAIVDSKDAGPVGIPVPGVVALFLSRQTNRTPWNLESWNLVIAAAHVSSER